MTYEIVRHTSLIVIMDRVQMDRSSYEIVPTLLIDFIRTLVEIGKIGIFDEIGNFLKNQIAEISMFVLDEIDETG